MPNAKDAAKISNRILVLGGTGTGKTSQFATLPGKKFAYLFDANAIGTLRGQDLDYEEYLPSPLSLDVVTLSKDSKGDQKRDSVTKNKGSEVYLKWERDFEEKLNKNFFAPYDWISFDSATTFLDLIMDRVLTLNGRPGTFPQQDDWGPQMVSFVNVMRTLIGMGKGVYVAGHLKTDKDEFTQRIIQLPLMTGQLREKIPLLFTDVFKATAAEDLQTGNVRHILETVPNQRETPIRTIIRGLKSKEDVTIDWSKPVVGQGLGGIILKNQTGVAQH
jgi:hypothetical protein